MEEVIIVGYFAKSTDSVIYELTPPIKNTAKLSQYLTPSIIEPSQGVTFPPNATLHCTTNALLTKCDTALHFPSSVSISNLQILLTISSPVHFIEQNLFIKSQLVYLDTSINYYQLFAMSDASAEIGKKTRIISLGALAISLFTGFKGYFKLVQIISFAEALLYFNVDYPKCVENFFLWFGDIGGSNYLTTVLLSESFTSAPSCRMPRVFELRGHKCSFLKEQFSVYFIAIVFLTVKLLAKLLSQAFTSLEKMESKIKIDTLYRYIDSSYFRISISSTLGSIYMIKNYERRVHSQFVTLIEIAISLFTMSLLLLFTFRSIRNIWRNSKRSRDDMITTNQMEELGIFFDTELVNLTSNSISKYYVGGMQLRFFLISCVLVTTQDIPIIHLIFTITMQLLLVLSLTRSGGLNLKSEWLSLLLTQMGYQVAYILPPVLLHDSLDPIITYYTVGIPILTLIALILSWTFSQLISKSLAGLLKLLSSKSSKNQVVSITSPISSQRFAKSDKSLSKLNLHYSRRKEGKKVKVVVENRGTDRAIDVERSSRGL